MKRLVEGKEQSLAKHADRFRNYHQTLEVMEPLNQLNAHSNMVRLASEFRGLPAREMAGTGVQDQNGRGAPTRPCKDDDIGGVRGSRSSV